MPSHPHQWLLAFDQELWRVYALDHHIAGLDTVFLSRYAHLSGARAARQFAADHALVPVDACAE
ncbi:hypothetical protein [Stenotrophomonas sp.]|uniref:hypothetical protein n=1 Tax=Stenotrophomonas sp. TaxID=69392 RepID=UPI0003181BA6|nr:hypothetical protein [Stenotrophomonas sp.]MBD3774196.1 hypothetical protein [Paracoccaceae bacterium]